jgi:hypothetical protein
LPPLVSKLHMIRHFCFWSRGDCNVIIIKWEVFSMAGKSISCKSGQV